MSTASEWTRRLKAAESELNETKGAQPRFTRWEPGALEIKGWITDSGQRLLLTTQRSGEHLDSKDAWMNIEAESAVQLARWILDTFSDEASS